MGYDLYGMNPQNNTEAPEILTKFAGENGWVEWDKMSEKDKELHYEARDKYEDENPGEYFRANVWFWRPIWNFVCSACDDIMTDKDMDAGCSNSGDRISKTKSKRMAARLRKLDKMGVIQAWEDEMMIPYKKAQANNKEVRKKLDAFQEKMAKEHGDDIIPAKYPREDYAKWSAIYSQEDWAGSYPPSRKGIVDFSRFCEESGGFEIC